MKSTRQLHRPLIESDETLDRALGGTVSVIQPRKGYRFAIDSVLLARFAAERPVRRAIDLGCGCGVVGLCLLALGGARELVGVDIQEEMVDRACRAAQRNGFPGAASFVTGDLRGGGDLFPPRAFDLAISNPPYRAVGSGRISPDPSTAIARHEVACALGDVVSAAAQLLAEGGEFCTVYPARRLAGLLRACCDSGLEPRVLRLVHPRRGESASLALLRCSRGGREGLEIRAPLVLHVPGARYSQEAEQLLGVPEIAAPVRHGAAPGARPDEPQGRG